MIFYIADMHLGHENVIKLCSRPFGSVEEMDETLIANWNKKVGKADTVYIVGDMMWKGAKHLEYLRRLKGKKILIEGNHDSSMLLDDEAKGEFAEIVKYLEVSHDNHPITLCHYPMLEWKNSRKQGSSRLGYLIYGHIHNKASEEGQQLLMSYPNALNAGVDINNFEPVTFDELYANNMAFKRRVLGEKYLALLGERERLMRHDEKDNIDITDIVNDMKRKDRVNSDMMALSKSIRAMVDDGNTDNDALALVALKLGNSAFDRRLQDKAKDIRDYIASGIGDIKAQLATISEDLFLESCRLDGDLDALDTTLRKTIYGKAVATFSPLTIKVNAHPVEVKHGSSFYAVMCEYDVRVGDYVTIDDKERMIVGVPSDDTDTVGVVSSAKYWSNRK